MVVSDRARTMDLRSGSLGSGVHFRVCLGLCVAIIAGAFAGDAGAQSPPAVFSPTGAEQVYVVPPGVSLVSIEAVGAPGGGDCGGGTGGLGARVTGRLGVSSGSVLYVEVGAPGAPGVLAGGFCAISSTGVFNGGGALGVVGAGGGGGASDVRVVPEGQAGSLGSRLIVAAGGGGAGGGGSVPGAAGGNAGSGGAGTRAGAGAGLTGPGAGGAADPSCAASALPGGFGSGGAGANDFPDNGGGGGGGGYWGGGGGGCEGGAGSGGGGGASYFAPQVGSASPATTTTAPPSVTITPIDAPSPPQGPARSRRRARTGGPPGTARLGSPARRLHPGRPASRASGRARDAPLPRHRFRCGRGRGPAWPAHRRADQRPRQAGNEQADAARSARTCALHALAHGDRGRRHGHGPRAPRSTPAAALSGRDGPGS